MKTSLKKILLLAFMTAAASACGDRKLVFELPERPADTDDDSSGDTDAGADADTDADMDTGADTDVDTDADTDTDADIDSSLDSETNTECDCFPAEKPCCDGCHFRGPDYTCDPEANAQYSCAKDDSCGGPIKVRYAPRYCAGQQYACLGEYGDWGEWQDAEVCPLNARCTETGEPDSNGSFPAEAVSCVLDLETCPVGFGEKLCFEGGELADCASEDCSADPPSLPLSATLNEVGGGAAGGLVQLAITVPDRWGDQPSFADIEATLKHGGKTAHFYNRYDGNVILPDLVTQFPPNWPIANFWGDDLSGTWELELRDLRDTTGGPLKVNKWCLTFPDPKTQEILTAGEWKDISDPLYDFGIEPRTVASFETHILKAVRSETVSPVLCLAIDHSEPAELDVELVDGNGNSHTIKKAGIEVIPASVELDTLKGAWLTGRYQLRIKNDGLVGGTLEAWSINLNKECNLPAVDGGKMGFSPLSGKRP